MKTFWRTFWKTSWGLLILIMLLAFCGATLWAQSITFTQIPAGIKKPGVYVEQDISLASHSLPSMARKVLVIGQRLNARIEPVRWQNGTLNDMTTTGTYTATTVKKYRVKIASTGTPDQYEYSENDGASWSVASSVTTTVALSSGVSVVFGATTGHAVSDEWRFNAYPGGTVATTVPTQIYSDSSAASSFGVGSLAHLMARGAMTANPYVDLTVIALDDNGAGVAASGTATIANAATAAGALRFYVGDQYVDIAIASGATATTTALNLANAIAAKSDLPVTASNSGAVVTVTAKNKGLCGNDILLGYTITSGISQTVTIGAMASGATNPTLQDALTAVYSARYHLIATPYNNATDLATLKAHVAEVSNALEQRGEMAVYSTTGTLAAATALAQQVNSERIAASFVRYSSSTQSKTPSWQLAAITAGKITADPDVADPVKNISLGIAAPAISDRLSRTEQESALAAGVGPIEVGPGESPRLVRLPLTYTQDANGGTVFLDFHKIAALDYARDAVISDLTAKSPKKIVREGNLTTVQILKSIVLDTAYRLQLAGVFTGVTNYKDLYIVEENATNVGEMDILMPSPVVDGLYVTAVKQVLY